MIKKAVFRSIRWQRTNDGSWISVLCNKVWIIAQDEKQLFYKVYEKGFGLREIKHTDLKPRKKKIKSQPQKEIDMVVPSAISTKSDAIGENDLPFSEWKDEPNTEKHSCNEYMKENEQILQDYFQFDISVCDLYKHWSKQDPHFKSVSSNFSGVRQLRQDPIENLFSFICSSNNNISRISSMVEAMCAHYGEKIAVVDDRAYYAFPTIDALAGPNVEQTLRNLKFGYRAKYISQTAKLLQNHGSQWLFQLRQKPYTEVVTELLKLSGVGPKVADCICLMSLDKHSSIPIDTHVFQVALRDYYKYPKVCKHKAAKSVTPRIYKDLGDFFRELWGEYAGWAQSVIFSAELPKFKEETKGKPKVHSIISPGNNHNGDVTIYGYFPD